METNEENKTINLKDLEDYNPSKLDDKVLADDWRWILTIYTNIKLGKKIKHSEELVVKTGLVILKEILRRVRNYKMVHTFKPKEMKKHSRGLFNKLIDKLNEKDKEFLSTKTENTMPVFPDKPGIFKDKAELNDLESIEPALLIEDYVTVVGSLTNWGETFGDIDVVVKATDGTPLFKNTDFRFRRSFTSDISKRFSFHEERRFGPFTSHSHLTDLWMLPKWISNIIFGMSLDDWRLMREDNSSIIEVHTMSANPEMFKALTQQKPLGGRLVAEPFTVEGLVSFADKKMPTWKDDGFYVGVKRDGATGNVAWKDGKVKVFTEGGFDVTNNIPTLVSQLKERKDSGKAIGEFELFIDGKHQNRADSSAALNHLNPEVESKMRVTLYDIFNYKGKWIDKLTYSERRKILTSLDESKNVQVSQPEFLVKTEKDLISAVKNLSKMPGSEGAMLKLASAPYEFNIIPKKPGMIKYKNDFQIVVRVIDKDKVEGAEAWVYTVAIDETEFKDKAKGENTPGALIVEPHARMIFDGEKKAILKSRDYNIIGRKFILVGDKAYGEIEFTGRDIIKNEKEFFDSQSKHKVTKTEATDWWGFKFPMYLFRFKFKAYSKPKDYKKPIGPQFIIKELVFAEKALNKASKTFISKTYNTSIKADVGDLLKVSFVDVSEYLDKTGQVYFNLFEPHVLEKISKGKTVSIKELRRIVAKTTGRVEKKNLDKEIRELVENKAIPINRRDDARTELPDHYPNDPCEYADSVNLFYPLSNKFFAEAAWRYWQNPGNRGKYTKDAQVHITERILDALDKFGVEYNSNRLLLLIEASKIREYVVQIHFRGDSAHGDFRYVNDEGKLDGFTLAFQTKELAKAIPWKLDKKNKKLFWKDQVFYEYDKDFNPVKEPTKALEEEVFRFHKNLLENRRFWKIDLKTGEQLKRRKDETTVEKIWSSKKADEPREWIKAEGVTSPRLIEDEPGGTRFYPGIFVTAQRGKLAVGTIKEHFEEFFTDKEWKGRFVVRKLRLGEKFGWWFWKADTMDPYVLSRRAEKEGWLPDNYSALPPEMEFKVPKALVYWNPKVKRADRLERRTKLRKFFMNREETKNQVNRFILSRRSYRGQLVIRGVPRQDFFLKLGDECFYLDKNILFRDSSAEKIKCKKEYFIEGEYLPGSVPYPKNLKLIPVYINVVEKGKFKRDGEMVTLNGQDYLFKLKDGEFYSIEKVKK